MNIKLRNIPKFLWGGNLLIQLPYYWNNLPTVFSFNNLSYYDPRNYPIEYDTSKLVNGDIFDTTDPLKYNGKNLDPWQSKIQGNVLGRYQPTTGHGSYGEHKNHYNYTKSVERNPYYKEFGKALVDETGKFTPTGEAWARAVDVLLPPGSKASFFGENNLVRDSWTVKDNDVHGRAPKTFNNLKDYVDYVRNDLILGARHNIFLSKGTRYFYTDKEGKRHWVSPEEAKKYELSSEPVEQGWEGGTYWNDYELLGLKNNSTSNTSSVKKEDESGRVDDPNHKKNYGFDWSKIGNVFKRLSNNPNLYAAGRLAGNLLANERIYDEYIKGIKPNLLQTYQTHRQVLGDEATKQAYYRRAAQGQTKAAQPFTSDADRQVAYMNEAKRIGDELRALGDLADNQEIKRTSDESNQHQWANTQRATEVANANLASLNKAIADKHSILAQKHAANWSSVDNFLLGLETRNNQKIAERKALLDLVWALQAKEALSEDPEIIAALKAITDYEKEYAESHDKTPPDLATDTKYRDLYNNLKKALNKVQIRLLQKRALLGNDDLLYVKDGNKITYKKKDDLLYKTAKDTVDHFREMSKLLKRKRRNKQEIVKLAPHPKGSTRRYLLGGVAPFTVYKPAPLGGETTISSQGSTSSTKADKVDPKKESLDMIKELFKSVSASGIPVDASLIYKDMNNFLAKSRLFGDELSTDDIASMYVNMMYKVNNLKFSGELYKEARKRAADNEALNEYAVDSYGNVIVLDKEGKGIKRIDLSELLENRDKYTPLTNNMLLQMRAYNPEMAFRTGDAFMDTVVANGVGITKITKYMKDLIGTLGSSELKIEGLSEVLSKKVKAGIQILNDYLDAAPDGVYEITKLTETQQDQAMAALKYIKGVLPIQQQNILKLHASEEGMTLDSLLLNMLGSQMKSKYEYTVDPLTGRTAKDANGNSKGNGNSENSAGLAFVLGLGPRELIDFNTGTSNAIRVLGIKGILLTHSKENLGQGATLLDATKSQQGGYLQWNKATFGGSKLNSQAYSHIILNDSTIVGMDLPYTKDINGNEVPDFLMAKKMELADLEILQSNIQNPGDKNKIYLKYGLPIKFDSNGNLNTMRYKRFAAIQVTLDEDSLLNKDAILSDEVAPAGEVERDLYLQTMKKSDKNYDLSDGMWLTGWGKDQIYKGTIFVPYSEDIAFAALSSGEPFKQDLPDNAKSIQLMLYAPKTSKYITPDKTLSQIKNN